MYQRTSSRECKDRGEGEQQEWQRLRDKQTLPRAEPDAGLDPMTLKS